MKRLIVSTLFLSVVVLAQDNGKPISVGGFDNTGSATFGYRFTDISGYEPKFNELFDLRSGPRLLDFDLFGTAQDGKNRFADSYSLTTSGIGGEPRPPTRAWKRSRSSSPRRAEKRSRSRVRVASST